MGSRFTAWISVRNESTWICVYRLRQLVVRKHAAELLACYGILFQDMGYLGSAHPE
jgi:3-methyladenine DNA glycosylase AlkC